MLEISPNALVSFKEEAAKRIKSYFGKKNFFSICIIYLRKGFIKFH